VKIGVSTRDGQKISRSLNRTNILKIFEVEKGKVVNKIIRYTYHSSKKKKDNQISPDRNPDIKKVNTVKNVTDGVKDCDVVICNRMNRRIWGNLGQKGVEMYFTSMTFAEEAVVKYLRGELKDEYPKKM
jgi:predicted Fe-Mo cluster-binding NifX family protein